MNTMQQMAKDLNWYAQKNYENTLISLAHDE